MTKLAFVVFGEYPTSTTYYWPGETRCLFSPSEGERSKVVKTLRLLEDLNMK